MREENPLVERGGSVGNIPNFPGLGRSGARAIAGDQTSDQWVLPIPVETVKRSQNVK